MLIFVFDAPHQAVTGLISDGTQSMEVVWNLCSMTVVVSSLAGQVSDLDTVNIDFF